MCVLSTFLSSISGRDTSFCACACVRSINVLQIWSSCSPYFIDRFLAHLNPFHSNLSPCSNKADHKIRPSKRNDTVNSKISSVTCFRKFSCSEYGGTHSQTWRRLCWNILDMDLRQFFSFFLFFNRRHSFIIIIFCTTRLDCPGHYVFSLSA